MSPAQLLERVEATQRKELIGESVAHAGRTASLQDGGDPTAPSGDLAADDESAGEEHSEDAEPRG